MNLQDLKNNPDMVLLEYVRGSHLYGTNTPQSDIDIGGIFKIPNNDWIKLTGKDVEEVSDSSHDIAYYELRRYMYLSMTANPTVLEAMFLPDDCVKKTSPEMEKLIENRDMFLTKKCFYSFNGYADQQIKKATGKNKKVHDVDEYLNKDGVKKLQQLLKDGIITTRWVDNRFNEKFRDYLLKDFDVELSDDVDWKVMDECLKDDDISFMQGPQKEDFCIMVTEDFQLRHWNPWALEGFTNSHMPFRPIKSNEVQSYDCSSVEHMGHLYRIYKNGKGVFKDNQLRFTSISKEREWKDFVGVMYYNEDEYMKNKKHYLSFWEWMSKRNEDRWVGNDGEQFEYDCYLDDETEFLTENGWKKYDDIFDSEKLGTVNKETLEFEWQKQDDKHKSIYSGSIYSFENRYTRFSVTSNHNLLVSDMHRSRNNLKYVDKESNWHLETVEDYFNSKKSHKHVLISAKSKNMDYQVSDDYIKLLGCYLSEGSIAFNHNNEIQYVSISQLESGDICQTMESLTEFDSVKYQHYRKGRNENTYLIKNKDVVKDFYVNCKHGCKNKCLPKIVNQFSTRQVKLLFDVLIQGDGSRYKKGHSVYYTTSKKLADDILALAVQHGILCRLMGPYNYRNDWLPIYHLMFSKKDGITSYVNKQIKNEKRNGWSTSRVSNKNIVCFSVKNGLLITRNKNKIAIQGNSKNMQHMARLILTARYIATEGTLKLRLEGDELKFLRDVRAGKYDYDYMMSFAKEKKCELQELFDKSDLPSDCPQKKAFDLYREIALMRN